MNKVYNGEISPKEAVSGRGKAEDAEIDWIGKQQTTDGQLNIDNADNSEYTEINGGVSNDSNRMDRGVAEGVFGRQGPRGRSEEAWGIRRGNQILPRRDLNQNLQRAFERSGVVATELYDFDADSAAFSSALASARKEDTVHGWAVTPQSAEDLQGKHTFMDAGSTIGFAVTDDGDIEAVFKNRQLNRTRRAMDGVMPQAIAAGGVKLDCYGEGLVNVYERYGFTPVARVEFNERHANSGWDASKGTPYVYFMVHNGDSAETVAAMARVCLGAEKIPSINVSKHRLDVQFDNVEEAIAMSAMYAANHLKGVTAIITMTESGRTALMTSRISSGLPIFAMSRHERTLNLTALYRGVTPVHFDSTNDGVAAAHDAVNLLRDKGYLVSGDIVIVTQGDVMSTIGSTNTTRVLTVE